MKAENRSDTEEHAMGHRDRTMVDVRNTSEGTERVPTRPIPIKNIRSLPVYRLLPEEDKSKISQTWSSAYSK